MRLLQIWNSWRAFFSRGFWHELKSSQTGGFVRFSTLIFPFYYINAIHVSGFAYFWYGFLKPEYSMVFCKTLQVEGLWIAWNKRPGPFVKMMSKNSISALTNRSRLGSDDFCWTKFLILGANQRYQRLLSPSQLGLWISVRTAQKPNSWTYNFVEVSGHNLDSSQT